MSGEVWQHKSNQKVLRGAGAMDSVSIKVPSDLIGKLKD